MVASAVVSAVCLGMAIATACLTPSMLRRLAAPEDAQPSPYLRLARPGFAVAVGFAAVAATAVVLWCAPAHLAAWCGLDTVVALAVCIDARTRYLPLRLAQAGWGLSAVGIAVTAAVQHSPGIVVRALLGALVLGALGWACSIVAGMGFGDVRLLATTGAVTAAMSWSTCYLALLLGTAAGAVVGVAVRLGQRPRAPFPYGPALWGGCYLALAYQAILR